MITRAGHRATKIHTEYVEKSFKKDPLRRPRRLEDKWHDIWYICQLQLGSHPVAVVQYTFTHKQYIKQHKTIHRTTQITTNLEEREPCSIFASFTLAFTLQVRKKHGKTSWMMWRRKTCSLQHTDTKTMVISRSGNRRAICSQEHEIACGVWKCTS